MEMFDYNGDNVKRACQTIKNSLSSDLLPKKWIERNKTNPMFGHCHTASACLQKLFGSENIKLYRALDDEDIWHWWAVTKEGELIDITVDQYTQQAEHLLMNKERKHQCWVLITGKEY